MCLKSSLLWIPPDGIALKLCVPIASKLYITFEISQCVSQSERIRRPLGKCTNIWPKTLKRKGTMGWGRKEREREREYVLDALRTLGFFYCFMWHSHEMVGPRETICISIHVFQLDWRRQCYHIVHTGNNWKNLKHTDISRQNKMKEREIMSSNV